MAKKKNCLLRVLNSLQAFVHIACCPLAGGRHAITSDLCPLTPKSEAVRRQVSVIGSSARLLDQTHTFSLHLYQGSSDSDIKKIT